MRRALAITTESGDLVFRQYCLVHVAVLGIAAGEQLDAIQREVEESLLLIRKSGFPLIVQCLIGILALVESLRGVEPASPVDERAFEAPPNGLQIAAFFYWVRQVQAKVHAGDFVGAARADQRAAELSFSAQTFIERADHVFLRCPSPGGRGRDRIRRCLPRRAPEVGD